MSTAKILSCLFILLASCATTHQKLAGPAEDLGQIGTAPYTIKIPADWNGDLVLVMHGYEPIGSPRQNPNPNDETGPMLFAKGYATAVSQYSTQGWAVGDAIVDNEALLHYFSTKYGKPSHTYLVGFSMGSLVALASLEKLPNLYSGALSLCGVNMSSSTAFQDGAMTSLVSFDYFFPGILPKLDDPNAPPMIDRKAVENALASNESSAQLLSKRLDVPRNVLVNHINVNYFILKQTQMKFGGFPVDNRRVVYHGFGNDSQFNGGVKRYSGNPKSIEKLSASAVLNGTISKPVVLRLSARDETVPARLGALYIEKVRLAGDSRYLTVLPPAGEGHCGFSSSEIEQSFDKLVQVTRQ